MFGSLATSASARFAVRAAVRAPRPATLAVARTFTTTKLARASGPPVIQGEGAKAGEVPSDEQQATGLERFELLGKMQGIDVFDMKPLQADRLGTTKNPIKVQSLFPERVIGCSGSPAGSHDNIYLTLNTNLKFHRCPECGSVYSLDFIGDPHAGHH